MSHTKSERNAEIVRRARAGQQTADIAAEFNVSLSRVYQILKATSPAPQMDRAPGGVRPRLRKKASGLWECTDGIVVRVGRSHQGAYQRWLTAVTAWADPDVSQPPAAPAEPLPESASACAPAPVEPFRGEIQVVPGTALRRPLALTPAMRIAQERARAAQPAMRSLGGFREGRS